MAKDVITEYDATANNNTVCGDVNIAENSALPSDMNNFAREIMSHLKEGLGSGTPLYVDQTNNRLGINISSPSVPLHLKDGNPRIRLEDSDASSHSEIQSNGQGDLILKADPDNNGSSTQISFETDGTEAMRISGGNVGIGTTSPAPASGSDTTLEIAGSTGPSLTINDTGQAEKYSLLANSDDLKIYYGSTPMVSFQNDGNVGIGTSSPSSFNSNANNLVVGSGSGGEGMTIYSGSTDNGAIFFADGTSGASLTMGGISYNHNDNSLNLRVNNDPKVYVTSDGNVLVGTTDSSPYNNTSGTGFAVDSGGYFSVTREGVVGYFNRNTSDGDIVHFRKNGTTVGSIGCLGTLTIGSDAIGLRFNYASLQGIVPWNLSTNSGTDDVIDLGYSSIRFDDIYATNGTIQTSDQQEKNTITDSDLGIDFIKRLTPKSYIFNGKTRTHYGLIAQDVETVLSDISKPTSGFAGFIKSDISEEQDGSEYRYGLRYTEFVAPLIQAVKDQQATIDALTARITALENGE